MIIGFDPGYGRHNMTGWAIMTDMDRVEAHGVIHLTAKTVDERLSEAASKIGYLLTSTAIPLAAEAGVTLQVAYELPISGINALTTIDLARLVGVIHGLAALHGLQVRSVRPTEAKAALTGNGRADKAAMIQAAELEFGLKGLSDAEADAIGIAISAASSTRAEEIFWSANPG